MLTVTELVEEAVSDRQSCTTGGDVSLEANCTLSSHRFRITVRSAQAVQIPASQVLVAHLDSFDHVENFSVVIRDLRPRWVESI